MTVLPHTINLRGDSIPRSEAQAAEAITPGMLIEILDGGTCQKRDTTGQAPVLIAFENELAGDDIDTDYASGDLVNYWNAQPGDRAYCLLADGQNVAEGALLIPATGGLLTAGTTAGLVVAKALEDKNLSASSNTTAGRIRVEFV